MKKYIALIPARGGSKSIPLKNIKKIAGKPLIYWTIEAAINCSKIEKVYLSTDSEKIIDVARNIKNEKIVIVNRSPETATDTASTESVMLEFANFHDFENIILIQATSPLLTSKDLEEAIMTFENYEADSLLSVVEQKRFIWNKSSDHFVKPLNYDPLNRPRRQDFKGYLVENGAFYITSKKLLQETKCRISGNIAYYKMPEETYYEIDELADWEIIEKLLLSRNKVNKDLKSKLKNVKLFITDVDGVMTDCGMYYSENGDELKKFNTRDGMGIQLLREKGIKTAIVTKEKTKIVEARANKLKVDEVYQGIVDKLSIFEELREKYSLEYSEIVYIGDDINDIPVLEKAGVSFCPNDAVDEVKNVSDYILSRKGGEGVIREVVEILTMNI
ncbi:MULTISPECIES: acylneuraminate cytidylyltransferase [Methanosarcina]|uniref:N-acylneuraminate cytidylyltransferase n=1 Tax=Methanosarcina vacuolata Z-761 TaxID=1434123 RepID=A0A0E3LGR9_9EURY|nr:MULTISPECIES: acylneuraminate cytidylyltransferase [Methanosarcina]AKB43001.1 N-Acetylneuraminate cytidylyltransferase [Methanosarcina vacuolata Z-761]AKB46492.1 N-Acetylneuraminate cytidylyltransferase [Methanosarcina sp. Kolksee]